jgi:hypothetical protein
MVALRAIAIASNAAFIAYGLLAGVMPVLILHLLLLPLNLFRIVQSWRARSRRVLPRCSSAGQEAPAPNGISAYPLPDVATRRRRSRPFRAHVSRWVGSFGARNVRQDDREPSAVVTPHAGRTSTRQS